MTTRDPRPAARDRGPERARGVLAWLRPLAGGAAAAAIMAVALLGVTSLVSCATVPTQVTKIVNGHVVVTRAIAPDAYEHVARALLFEEEQRWDEVARELERALQFDDQAAEVRARLAEVYLRLGRLDDAADEIEQSLATAPTVSGYLAAAHLAEARHDDNTALVNYRTAAANALEDGDPEAIEDTHLALSSAELAALDLPGAYATIRVLRDAAPDNARARVELAALAWAQGRLPEAETALVEALGIEPEQIDARLVLAALRVASGHPAEAKATFREALDRAEDSLEIAEMYLKWLSARGDKVEAGEEADRLVPDVVDETTVDAIVRLERAAGRPARARAAAERALQKGVSASRVALLVAGALGDAKDFSGAAARLLKVRRADPEFVESRLRAAEVLRRVGGAAALRRAANALDEATDAVSAAAGANQASATPTAKVVTPSAAAAAGKPRAGGVSAAPAVPGPVKPGPSGLAAAPPSAPVVAGAEAAAEGAGAPSHDWISDLIVARALLDEKRGEPARAVRGLDLALQKDPDNARFVLVRAAIDERRGEWQAALILAEKILRADPRHVEALNFCGFIAADHDRDLPTAIRRLQVAMVLNPGAGGIVDSLGWAHLHAGDLTRASELLLEADRLEPGDSEILSHLGELYSRQKQIERAVVMYRKALEYDPDERVARDIEQHLRSLESMNAAGR